MCNTVTHSSLVLNPEEVDVSDNAIAQLRPVYGAINSGQWKLIMPQHVLQGREWWYRTRRNRAPMSKEELQSEEFFPQSTLQDLRDYVNGMLPTLQALLSDLLRNPHLRTNFGRVVYDRDLWPRIVWNDGRGNQFSTPPFGLQYPNEYLPAYCTFIDEIRTTDYADYYRLSHDQVRKVFWILANNQLDVHFEQHKLYDMLQGTKYILNLPRLSWQMGKKINSPESFRLFLDGLPKPFTLLARFRALYDDGTPSFVEDRPTYQQGTDVQIMRAEYERAQRKELDKS